MTSNSNPSGSQVTVSDATEQSRFVAVVDDERVGYAEYRVDGPSIVFTHTVVDDAAEGKGVGSALASTGLDSARDRGLRVVPRCQFIAGYISRHPEYLDLVDEENRGLVDAARG